MKKTGSFCNGMYRIQITPREFDYVFFLLIKSIKTAPLRKGSSILVWIHFVA